MILDANVLGREFFGGRQFDVAIAGGGVAGIIAARRLAAHGLRVALIEAGGTEFTEESQDFYKGETIGHDYFDLDVTRLRYLGGTSNHWAGWCRPLDPIDFESRDYVEWSGWPISHEDLEPYLKEAASILDISADFDAPADPTDENLQPVRFQYSPPTRLRPKYEGELAASDRITTFLNLSVTDIRLNEAGTAVEHLQCRRSTNADATPVELRADRYVLAMGGLEIPRLLLNSNSQLPAGIGNQRDLVGRFFMDHPHFNLGQMIVGNPGRPALGQLAGLKEHVRALICSSEAMRSVVDEVRPRFTCRRLETWAVTPAFMRSRRILNCGIRVRVNTDSDSTFNGRLDAAYEQMPNPDSRLTLSDDVDAYGLRRLVLDWRLSELDRRTARETAIEIGKKLISLDNGRLKLADWLMDDSLGFPGLDVDEVAGHHHMGTTRMANGPERGVVDANCKVFGIEDLFITSSSVFPTAGHANPTLTIAQLSLRLADHLREKE